MRLLSVKPSIEQYDTFRAFADAFHPGAGDLILTDRMIWKGHEADAPGAAVLFVSDYGTGEPSDEMAERILADLPGDCRRVIGIGGGTVLDIAKVIAVWSQGSIGDLFDKKVPCRRQRALILVPTTCGTGSEVTNLSIFAFPSRGTKFGLADDALFPDEAVLIPELLHDLPWRPFIASAVDALVHSLESWLSPGATPVTRLFSEKAAEMLLTGFTALRDKGQDARREMLGDFLLASNLAGIAFGNAGCGAVHALSYPLGGVYHVPHGESNRAMLMPVFYGYGSEATAGLRALLGRLLGCGAEEALDALGALIETLLPAKTMREYGVRPEEIGIFTDSVLESQQRLLKRAPVPMTRELIRSIYVCAYGAEK